MLLTESIEERELLLVRWIPKAHVDDGLSHSPVVHDVVQRVVELLQDTLANAVLHGVTKFRVPGVVVGRADEDNITLPAYPQPRSDNLRDHCGSVRPESPIGVGGVPKFNIRGNVLDGALLVDDFLQL